MQLVAALPFDDAVQKLGSRSPVGAMLTSAEWQKVPVALRETAFFSATIENVRFLQRAQAALLDWQTGARDPQTGALKTGSRAAFVDQMSRFAIAEGMGPLNERDRGGLRDITSAARQRLIFDTMTKAAADYANWKQGMDPDALFAYPAQRFIRVRRVKKPRSYHQAALGMVRLKTETAFWVSLNKDFGLPWGPWGFNSGCDVEDVDRTEAEGSKLLRRGERVQPVDRPFNENLKASLVGVSQPLRDVLSAFLGDRAVIEGETVRWRRADEPIPPPATPAFTPPAPIPAPPVADPTRLSEPLAQDLARQLALPLAEVEQMWTTPEGRAELLRRLRALGGTAPA